MNDTKNKIIIYRIIFVIFVILIAFLLFNLDEEDVSKNEIVIEKEPEVIRNIDMSKTDNVRIEDDTKYNISDRISEVHEYKQYKFNNMTISASGDYSYLEFDITNLSVKEDVVNYTIFISFIDKKGNDYLTIPYILPSLKVGESIKDELKIPFDAANAYDYTVSGFIEEYSVQ